MNIKNILFVCKYNRFRSKVAEGWFKKLNKNSLLKAKSAGVIQGSPTDKEIFEACKKADVKIKKSVDGVSTDLLKWQNILVIVADDVPPQLFDNEKYGKKTLIWNIQDTHGGVKEMLPIIQDIREKVKILLGELEK